MEVLNPNNIRSEVAIFMAFVSQRKQSEAREKGKILLEYLEGQKEPYAKGLLSFVKGVSHVIQNQYKEAASTFESGISIPQLEEDIVSINYFGNALAYRSMGKLDEAVNHLFNATEYINPQGAFKIFLTYCYHQLGEIHVSINEHQIALEYFHKNLAILNNPDNHTLFRIYNGMGGCYQSMKQYEKSLEFHQKALEVKGISSLLLSKGQNDFGALYLEMNELNKAEELLKKSIQLREENNFEDAACTSMFFLAEVYLKQNKIKEALELLDRCKKISDKYHTKWKDIKILSLTARAHALNLDYKNAVEHYEKYNTLQNEVKAEQEKNIIKLKNEQIEKQKKIIQEKHQQLASTFDEIKHLKIDRKAMIFSWITVIALVLISEMFLDPLIENLAYDNLLSLAIKVLIALLFKPLDGMYEKILWDRAIKKVE